MEMMNYSEKRKKSLKGPAFAIASFLCIGTGVIVYAMLNEKEPIIIGSKGALSTGEAVKVVEQDAFLDLTQDKLSSMYEIKSNLISDTSNERIKSDINIPFVYIDSTELASFNSEIKGKFENSYNSFKENMSDVQHNFTYRVSYESYENIIKSRGVLSILITEKMVEDETSVESMNRRYTYNIDLLTGEILEQSDIIVDVLGPSYSDLIKDSLSSYLADNKMVSKENYNYAYTGLENYYFKNNGEFHFVFNLRRFSR